MRIAYAAPDVVSSVGVQLAGEEEDEDAAVVPSEQAVGWSI